MENQAPKLWAIGDCDGPHFGSVPIVERQSSTHFDTRTLARGVSLFYSLAVLRIGARHAMGSMAEQRNTVDDTTHQQKLFPNHRL
jgi:hypothetical protein